MRTRVICELVGHRQFIRESCPEEALGDESRAVGRGEQVAEEAPGRGVGGQRRGQRGGGLGLPRILRPEDVAKRGQRREGRGQAAPSNTDSDLY